jgi:hypothetical protein
MDTKVTAVIHARGRPGQAGRPGQSATHPAQTRPWLDLRLVIEEDQGSGSFVYKTVNRVTGESSRSQAGTPAVAEAKYAAGSVVKTRPDLRA